MTTLVSWVTYDQNKQASIYVASDSRFSWSAHDFWDSGRKIYCSSKYPDILGYCGDVLFCSQVISQVMTYVDSCEAFELEESSSQRFNLICALVVRSFGEYPKKYIPNDFEIIYVTRSSRYCFSAYSIFWSGKAGWVFDELNIPTGTGLVLSAGSGAKKYRDRYTKEFERSDIGGFSRAYYSCLYRHVSSGDDPRSGGPLQIAGVFNNDTAMHHGVVMNGRRYVYGMEIDETQNINCVRWVNERFENCDGQAMKRYEYAQPQPLPRSLDKPLGKGSR